jgi:hypothetical protein
VPEVPANAHRNFAQVTSGDWSKAYTSFYGTTNNCPQLGKVLTAGMQDGDTVKVRIVLKYDNIVPANGQTAKIWMQGSGNVTDWGYGTFPDTSGVKTLNGSGEIVFESTDTINSGHLKNAYWNWAFRTDYVASGSIQWKEGKVEIGKSFTPYTPAPEQLGWSTDTLVPTQTQRYLWKFEYIYYSDGSVEVTQPTNISIAGADGTNGQTSHVHFAFADDATGGGFSLTTPKAYMGWYADFNETASNDPTKYKWGKWEGDQGVPGKPGADGKTPYIHFAYADDNKGTNFSLTDNNQQYQGYYSDYTEANSSDYKKYTWVDRLANVKGGSRNYFKNSLTKTFYTTDAQTFDWRTYIVDAFWKNKDRLKKNFVKMSFDITFPIALENDYTANIHFSATPWYSNRVTFKAGTTSRQHFEFEIDLSSASENYRTDNVFIRFGTQYGFPSGFKIILENMMLSIGSYYPDYIQAVEDTQEQIDSKADQALTQDQLNALAEKNRNMEAEMSAKASLAEIEQWKQVYDSYVAQNDADKTEAEQKLITLTSRIAEWVKDWQDKKVQWSFLDTNMDFGEEGLRLGKKGSPTSILISNDRIGFYSGGSEVASMSNGTLTIDNGIFAKSLQIGHYREEVYEGDKTINVIRWVD